jgi:hypothetical protein
MAFTDLTLDPSFRKNSSDYVDEVCDDSVLQNEIRELL